jgi:hypothetical protein
MAAIEIAIDWENARGTSASARMTVACPIRRRRPFLLPL